MRWNRCFPLLLLLALCSLPATAQAAWSPIDDRVDVTVDLQTTGGPTIYAVTIGNTSGEEVEGTLRLLVTMADGYPDPVNADGLAGEDGQDPTPYFWIDTAQEGLFEPGEAVTIPVEFAYPGELVFEVAVELNEATVYTDIFRRNVSKTAAYASNEGGIDVMPLYVDGMNSKGEPVYDPQGNRLRVKPLVVVYAQEVEGREFNSVPDYMVEDEETGELVPGGERVARDIYAAVSTDGGATWKRRNISRTAEKSSFLLDNGVEYPGDSETPDMVVEGGNVFVTWVDKYCPSGNPWSMPDDAVDLFHVQGSQAAVDYMDPHGDDPPRPDLGQRPYSCLWSARGVLDPLSGEVAWYKSEQLTTGRRDVYRNFVAASDYGFAVSWQEDPKGLKTGKGRGPGAGMSGACVNHKTDVWYTFMPAADFTAIDPDYVPSGDGDDSGDAEYACVCGYVYAPKEGDPLQGVPPGVSFAELPADWSCPLCGASQEVFEKEGRPHALHAFHPPVPLTDNAVCRDRVPEEVWGYACIGYEEDGTKCDYTYEGGTSKQPETWDELPADWICPACGAPKDDFIWTVIKTRHEGAPYCDQFADNPRVDRDGNYVAPGDVGYETAFYTAGGVWVMAEEPHLYLGGPTCKVDYAAGRAYIGIYEATWTGEALDGDTGSSRPNLDLVTDPLRGPTAILAYEETKGLGEGGEEHQIDSAPQQKTPVPTSEIRSDDGLLLGYTGAYPNDYCVSCHFSGVVPVDRVVPKFTPADCEAIGGVWDQSMPNSYFPYEPYPFYPEAGDEIISLGNLTMCVKFYEGREIYDKGSPALPDHAPDAYYALPGSMPGWHAATSDCIACHVPFGTKDTDEDGFPDKHWIPNLVDLCPQEPTEENVYTVDYDGDGIPDGCNEAPQEKRLRQGKNVFYHAFPFAQPEVIGHGVKLNLPGMLGEENGRRVRLAPQTMDSQSDTRLMVLYKQGIGGQGAPADAIARRFVGGVYPENLLPGHLNLSAATALAYKPPDDTEEAEAIENGHARPKIEEWAWSDDTLDDETGLTVFKVDAEGNPILDEIGEPIPETTFVDGVEVPVTIGNPYENVFSTRLDMRGDMVVAAYAYCPNWAAARRAKDHYDFYVRVSLDGGVSWGLPVNVSRFKNNEVTTSDCRVVLPPGSIESGEQPAPAEDVYAKGRFYVAIGAKANVPQPSPKVLELEESEEFLDITYTWTEDWGATFETVTRENPKYDPNALPYLDPDGVPTDSPLTCDDLGICVENEPNPALEEFIEDYDWLAKGEAAQGDVQLVCTPDASQLFAIWEQELPISVDDPKKHEQGADLWFRRLPAGDVPLTAEQLRQGRSIPGAYGLLLD